MLRLRAIGSLGSALILSAAAAGCSSPASTPSSQDSGVSDASIAAGGASADAAVVDAGPPSLCGNGRLDPGEQCDDGNEKNKDGCDDTCVFSCVHGVSDDVCSDGNYCNGPEVCNADHTCGPSTGPLADGTICGQANKCQAGVCQTAAADCGDSLVEPPEECDNGSAGDSAGCVACRFTCVSSDPTRNCIPADSCAGKGSCDDGTHVCTPGTPLKDLTPCGSGEACISGACTSHYCSNGQVDPGEECDDGNLVAGDGCEPDCKFTCLASDTTRNCHSSNTCINSGLCSSSTHLCSPLLPKTAGTACGTKDDCVAGNCVQPICGDGIVAQGIEECDDGNSVDGDGCDTNCTFSCHAATAATDCAAKTPSCRSATCSAGHVCSSVADNANTAACTFGAMGSTTTSTCAGGNCGTCGNGTVDTGEQCDDGNAVSGDGCEPNCTFSCTASASCDDGDPCNGAETCNTTTHQCALGTSEATGTTCGTGKVCIDASCRPSICGDGYTDATKNETCDPPNTVGCDASCKALTLCDISGDWALKVTESVSWGDGQVLLQATGQIYQWAKLSITQTGTAFTATLRACGLTIPDFHTSVALGDEWYGTAFPNAMFDKSTMPTFSLTGSLSNVAPGADVEIRQSAVLLGLTIPTTEAASVLWPDDPADLLPANGFTIVDQDSDGNPGITALAKTGTIPAGSPGAGATYRDPIEDLSNGLDDPGRANELYLVIRQITSQSGTLNSCTSMSGTSTASIDNHIIGCQVDGGGTCSLALLDGARPLYTVSQALFSASKVTTGAACAAVRAAQP